MVLTFWHLLTLIMVFALGTPLALYVFGSGLNALERGRTPRCAGYALLLLAALLQSATLAGFFTLLDRWFLR